jgi:hypothetical protein
MTTYVVAYNFNGTFSTPKFYRHSRLKVLRDATTSQRIVESALGSIFLETQGSPRSDQASG